MTEPIHAGPLLWVHPRALRRITDFTSRVRGLTGQELIEVARRFDDTRTVGRHAALLEGPLKIAVEADVTEVWAAVEEARGSVATLRTNAVFRDSLRGLDADEVAYKISESCLAVPYRAVEPVQAAVLALYQPFEPLWPFAELGRLDSTEY